MAYKSDLQKRLELLKNEIKSLELLQKQYAKDMFSEKFESITKELNEKKISQMTVESRLKNLGRNFGGIEVMVVDENLYKNKTR